MADETTQQDNQIDKLLGKYEDMLRGHKTTTEEELIKMRRKMEETLHESTEASKRVVDELKDQLSSITGWIEDEKKARTEKDRVKESEHTMVVPPEDVTPPQPPPTPETTEFTDDDGKKRGTWKKFW